MKTIKAYFVLLLITFSFPVFSQTLIINEVSNGSAGNQEYVEFVVVSNTVTYDCSASTPPCIDIRGWIFDDNSGYHGTGGIATGAVRFSQNLLWSCVPLGTIILIYNNGDVNPAIPAADLSLSDGNCQIIAPVNSTLFETNATTPGAVACSYPITGWIAGGDWNKTLLANPGDCARIVNLAGCEVFSVCWGSNNLNNQIYFSGSGAQKVQYFNGVDPYNTVNWTNASNLPSPGAQTPGSPNNAANAAYIAQFNNACLPILPLNVSAISVNAGCTCNGSATASASGSIGGYTYEWFDAGYNPVNQTTAIATGLCAGTYHVIATSYINCKDTATVIITDIPAPTVTINSTTVCNGASTTLIATPSTGGGTYLWGTGEITASITVTPSSTTTYTCVYTLNGCPSTVASGIVTVNPLPTLSAGVDQIVCVGTTVTWSGSGATTYTWDNGITNGTAFTPAVGTVTYTVTGTDINGCVNTDQMIVTVNPLPTVSAGVDQIVCIGTTVTWSGSGATTYTWDNGITNGTAFTPAVGTLTYTVTGTDVNGCVNTDQVDVTVLNEAPINAGSDQVVCEGTSVTLTATGGVSYTWDNGVTNGTSFTPIVGTITYTLNGADASGCAGTDQVDITVNPLPTVSVGVDQIVCIGTTVTLNGSGVTTYTWDNGITNGTAFTPAVGTVTYTVTGTDINGCVNTDQVDITVNPLPNVSAGVDQIVCIGTTVTLSGSGATTYTWDNGITNGTEFTPAAGTVTYTVTGTDINGCVNTDQMIVTVTPQIVPVFTQISPICEEDNTPVISTVSGNSTAITGTWSPSLVDNTTTGTYTFTPAVGQCAGIAIMTITVNPLPLLVITNPASVCYPNMVDISNPSVTVGSTGTLSYYSNAIGTLAVASPASIASSGTYYIQAVSPEGCKVISPVQVEINPQPIAEFTPSPAKLSAYTLESTMVNTSTGATTYEWFFEGNESSVETSPIHEFSGEEFGDQTIILVATNQYGCQDTAIGIITIVEELIFFVPNTFTPNGDETNDTFFPVFTSGYDPYNYSLVIFNRWGQIVFESYDATKGWNGRMGIEGDHVQDGTYSWKIEFSLKENGGRKILVGHVNLLK